MEFDNVIDHVVEAEMIFINGGQLIVGFEDDPMLKNVLKLFLNSFYFIWIFDRFVDRMRRWVGYIL